MTDVRREGESDYDFLERVCDARHWRFTLNKSENSKNVLIRNVNPEYNAHPQGLLYNGSFSGFESWIATLNE